MKPSRLESLRSGLARSLLGAALLCPTTLGAQTARVQVAENFRAEPNGTVLGRLRPGVELHLESQEGSWVQATLEEWLWTRSLQVHKEDPYDLVVSADGGENVRSEPSGQILGHMEKGTLLEEVERRPGWIRFRRTGWIWASSVEIVQEQTQPPDSALDRWMRSGRLGTAVLSGPDGDTLAHASPGTELRIVAQEGNWARVRMEGWVWRPEAEEAEPRDTAVFTNVTPKELADSPERYTGRVVSLSLQFISAERAEKVRTDFYEGEPFLLTRALSGDRSFVYVAVPPDRLGEVQGITPLERINVVGRVRTVAAKLTGNPVLELLDLSRPQGGG